MSSNNPFCVNASLSTKNPYMIVKEECTSCRLPVFPKGTDQAVSDFARFIFPCGRVIHGECYRTAQNEVPENLQNRCWSCMTEKDPLRGTINPTSLPTPPRLEKIKELFSQGVDNSPRYWSTAGRIALVFGTFLYLAREDTLYDNHLDQGSRVFGIFGFCAGGFLEDMQILPSISLLETSLLSFGSTIFLNLFGNKITFQESVIYAISAKISAEGFRMAGKVGELVGRIKPVSYLTGGLNVIRNIRSWI